MFYLFFFSIFHISNTSTQTALGAGWEPAIGASFPASTYWSGPMTLGHWLMSLVTVIEPTPLCSLQKFF
jgi:hypothetical protein